MKKKVNQQDWQRLQRLNSEICDLLSNNEQPLIQSRTIWRGDMRAIQWAAWWIRETLREQGQLG